MLLGLIGVASSIPLYASTDPDYILGREMTEDEIQQQMDMIPELTNLAEDDPVDIYEDESAIMAASEGDDDLLFSNEEGNSTSENQFPESYDLRDSSITAVKNQGSTGVCWAFSATSMAETSMIKQYGWSTDTDFSEFQLAYCLFNRSDDPLHLTTGDSNSVGNSATYTYKNNGANNTLSAFELAGWTGTEWESTAPFSFFNSYNDGDEISQDIENASVAKLTNAIFISNDGDDATEQRQIKEAVMDYGSVAVGIYFNKTTNYYNASTAAYADKSSKDTNKPNHAVTIVGWDDHYSATNFPEASGVSQDGAWIVKNSWGDQWGDQGYFYMSYETVLKVNSVAYSFTEGDSYDNNYHYDGTSGSSALGTTKAGSESNRTIANVYTAKGNDSGGEILKAVNFALKTANVSYSIQIYRNLTDANDPSSGEAVLAEEIIGETTYPGIYTVDLDTPVYLSEGETFSVAITLPYTVQYYVECSSTGTSYSSTAVTDVGQSFEYRGGKWSDLGQRSSPLSARIKAFTCDTDSVDSQDEEFSLDLDEESGKPKLGWTAAEGAVVYRIYRSSDQEGSYYSWVADVASTENTWIDTEAGEEESYRYKIAPIYEDAIGDCLTYTQENGESKDYVSNYMDIQQLDKPDLQLQLDASENYPILEWDSVENASYYKILRKSENESKYLLLEKNYQISDIDSQSCRYEDITAEPGLSYRYKVISCRKRSETTCYRRGESEAISIYPESYESPQLSVSENSKGNTVISWDSLDTGAGEESKNAYLEIYYKDKEEDDFSRCVRVSTSESSYTDREQVEGRMYKMRLMTNDASSVSYGSFTESFSGPDNGSPALSLSLNDYQSLILRWNAISNIKGYELYRSESKNGNYQLVRISSKGAVKYTDKGLSLTKKYYYRMRTYRCLGSVTIYGKYSSIQALQPKLATPLTSSKAGKKSIRLKWSKITGASGYQIVRSTKKNGSYSKVKTLGKSSTSWTTSSLKSRKYYYYKIRAYRIVNGKKYYSNYSKIIKIKLA